MISEETDKELPYLPSIMGKPYCKQQLQYGSPFIYIAQKSNSFNKDLYVLRNLLMAIFLILPGLLLVINSFSKAVSAMCSRPRPGKTGESDKNVNFLDTGGDCEYNTNV